MAPQQRVKMELPCVSVSDYQNTAQVFGIDVYNLTSSSPATIFNASSSPLGYPLRSLSLLPLGSYFLQADFALYSLTVRSSDSDSDSDSDSAPLYLPVSCLLPEPESATACGPKTTLFSDVTNLLWQDKDEDADEEVNVVLQRVNTGDEDVDADANYVKLESKEATSGGCSGVGADTNYIKTVTVDSALLSKFWGRPITLTACVLLPYEFESRVTTYYPLVIAHGHFSETWQAGGGFSTTPPPPGLTGYDAVAAEYDYYLYTNWTSPSGIFAGARMLVATIQHPVPFFDDSYAVNSANIGPYGDAIMFELIPVIESRYRGLGSGWARGTYGGSTGGWESLAVQVFYPDQFNGAYSACPDPITFTSYVTTNIYTDKNAYYYDSTFKRTPKPGTRDSYDGLQVRVNTSVPDYAVPYGQTTATAEEMNLRELVLGTHSRSCQQYDIWEAVFSPVGPDGYPARIWDKLTGDINRTVAEHWRENYDLVHIIERDWNDKEKALGQKLQGKIHLFAGAMDSFFLDNPTMDAQAVLESLLDPPYDGSVTIGAHDGRGFEHCFNGYLPDGTVAPNAVTRNLYNQKFLPLLAKRFRETAPQGANLEWSQY